VKNLLKVGKQIQHTLLFFLQENFMLLKIINAIRNIANILCLNLLISIIVQIAIINKATMKRAFPENNSLPKTIIQNNSKTIKMFLNESIVKED